MEKKRLPGQLIGCSVSSCKYHINDDMCDLESIKVQSCGCTPDACHDSCCGSYGKG